MITKHKINMDLTRRTAPARLCMVQGDAGSRAVEFTITENGMPWADASVEAVFLRYRRSNLYGGSYDTLPDGTKAWHMEGNVLTVIIAPQLLASPGLVEAQVGLLKGEKILTTYGFQILVEEDMSAEKVEPEDYINWAAWAQTALDDRLAQAEASGDFDGATFTPSVDPAGILSWTNDQNRENPGSVNIVDLLADKLGQDMFLRRSGGTMAGNLDMGGKSLTGLKTPEAETDAVTKGYADWLYRQKTLTIPAAFWSGQQVGVQIAGVTENNLVILTPDWESVEEYTACGVRCTAQTQDLLTFACDRHPEKTLKVNAAVFLRGNAE